MRPDLEIAPDPWSPWSPLLVQAMQSGLRIALTCALTLALVFAALPSQAAGAAPRAAIAFAPGPL